MKLKKELEKKHNKKEKGITLVALVITVVIMLILAAVAIGSVTGDGLFNRTRQAAEAYENASKKELEHIQTLMNEIDEYLTGNTGNEEVEPGEVAKIGDFVNYSVQVDSNGNDVIDEGETYDKWRILDLDNNGHMEIVCYNGPSFSMGGKNDYANAIKILNDESEPYGNGTYGYSTRHLGSDPSEPSSYATIDESYIKFYSGGSIPSETRASLEQTHHESDLAAIKSFSNTEDGKKLAGDSNDGNIWLASRNVVATSSNSYFCEHFVTSHGGYGDCTLYGVDSDGSEYVQSNSYHLAPVVILESGIKIDTSTAGNGSEESPWTLTK